MASFIAHGLLGAGVMAAAASEWSRRGMLKDRARIPLHYASRFWETRSRALRSLIWVAALSFVIGTLPDTVDWVAAVLGLAPRWELYVILHHGPPWILLLLPPYVLHLVVDVPFHAAGGNWWPVLWWGEVLMWVVGVGLLILAYCRIPRNALEE